MDKLTEKQFKKLKDHYLENGKEIDFVEGWYAFQFKYFKFEISSQFLSILISPSLNNPEDILKRHKEIFEDCEEFMRIIK